jgi:hypothetical protein
MTRLATPCRNDNNTKVMLSRSLLLAAVSSRALSVVLGREPDVLDVLEESDPARRDILWTRTHVDPNTNHITIMQFCDQKTRAYKFDYDKDALRPKWIHRPNFPLLERFQPDFEIVFEHRGCLQVGDSVPIIVRAGDLIRDIYYRRCNGHHRNVCGQALFDDTGKRYFTKARVGPLNRELETPFRPFWTELFKLWKEVFRGGRTQSKGSAAKDQPTLDASAGEELALRPLTEASI